MNFQGTSLANNSIGCNPMAVLEAPIEDKRWPLGLQLPHYLDISLRLPSCILGSFYHIRIQHHPSNALNSSCFSLNSHPQSHLASPLPLPFPCPSCPLSTHKMFSISPSLGDLCLPSSFLWTFWLKTCLAIAHSWHWMYNLVVKMSSRGLCPCYFLIQV